jgi:hypothetical protein
VEALASQDVPVIVMKAAALIETAYAGDLGLRQFRDVDLFVREADVATAVKLLEPLGFKPLNAAVEGNQIVLYEAELALRKSDIVEVTLALHWQAPAPPGHADDAVTGWLWDTAVRPEPGLGLRLGPEAQVLYLSALAALRHAGRLLWLHDIAEWLHHSPARLDWEGLASRAVDFGLAAPLAACLEGLEAGWGASVPPGLAGRLREAEMQARNADRATASAGPRTSGRLAGTWRRLFPPPDYIRRKYAVASPLLVPLYYPYRWIRLLAGMDR